MMTDIRPTHVHVELRLTAGEADALEPLLDKLAKLVSSRVVTLRASTPEELRDVVNAMEKLRRRVGERPEPFEVTR